MNRKIPLILAVALFMENMDSTVISTSLPAIADDIGTSPVALKLALTAYLVSLAIFIPISAWMADRFGAKRIFGSAIGVFMVGSIACAAADSLAFFVVARFIQGMGGAMMTPIARLVLVRTTNKRDLVNAMAWLTIPGLVGPLVGPPLGGFVTTFFTWHWIFLINVPIGIVGIVFSMRFLPEVERQPTARIDWPGFVLSSVAASGIVFGLSVVSLPALPPAIGVATVLVGIAAGAMFLRHIHLTPKPLLEPALFRIRTFRAAITGGNLFRIGSGAVPFLLPLMLQLGFGLSPFQSGMLTFASALGAIAMKFLAPAILRTGGFRSVLLASAILSAISFAANALFTPQTSPWLIIAVLVAGGFMRSLFFTASNVLAYADISPADTSQASAISAVTQQVSLALGVAAGGMLLELTVIATGEPIGASSFMYAFFGVAAISTAAIIPFLALPASAGDAVSGHGAPGPVTSQADQETVLGKQDG